MTISAEQVKKDIVRIFKRLRRITKLSDWHITTKFLDSTEMQCPDCFMEVEYNRQHGYACIRVNITAIATHEFKNDTDYMKCMIVCLLHEIFHVRMEPYLMTSGVSDETRQYITERASTGVDWIAEFFCEKSNITKHFL